MLSASRFVLALAALAFSASCSSTATDPEPMAFGSPEEAAMMERMMELATPGPEHAGLMECVGTWTSTLRTRWAPDAEWMVSTGRSVITPMLGGRYIKEEMAFEMMGMPMHGISIVGYDKQTGEYTSMWGDTMSTWWTTTRGKAQADGTVDYRGMMTDVAGTRPFRMVVKADGQRMHVDMYDTIPPEGEVLVMTIDSRKVSGGTR